MPHQETHLQQLMDNLRGRLLLMAARTQQATDDAAIALMEHNMIKAKAVAEGDADLDAMEVELDDSILQILARSQPVACDLRLLLSGVRLIVDLERIGDEAVNVARRAILMHDDFSFHPSLPWLGTLCTRAGNTLHDAIQSFRDGDAALALHIRNQQDETTQMAVSGYQHIMRALQAQEINAWYALHLILVTRALERICGRAANVAEHAYFLVEGINIKHTSVEKKEGNANG